MSSSHCCLPEHYHLFVKSHLHCPRWYRHQFCACTNHIHLREQDFLISSICFDLDLSTKLRIDLNLSILMTRDCNRLVIVVVAWIRNFPLDVDPHEDEVVSTNVSAHVLQLLFPIVHCPWPTQSVPALVQRANWKGEQAASTSWPN